MTVNQELLSNTKQVRKQKGAVTLTLFGPPRDIDKTTLQQPQKGWCFLAKDPSIAVAKEEHFLVVDTTDRHSQLIRSRVELVCETRWEPRDHRCRRHFTLGHQPGPHCGDLTEDTKRRSCRGGVVILSLKVEADSELQPWPFYVTCTNGKACSASSHTVQLKDEPSEAPSGKRKRPATLL